MNLFRDGRLVNPNGETGNRLVLEVEEHDALALADPERRRTGIRFSQVRRGCVAGWAPEDKAHMELIGPNDPRFSEFVFTLHLDFGGDLYFVFSDNEALREPSCRTLSYPTAEVVTADPRGQLGGLGIDEVGVLYADRITRALESPERFAEIYDDPNERRMW